MGFRHFRRALQRGTKFADRLIQITQPVANTSQIEMRQRVVAIDLHSGTKCCPRFFQPLQVIKRCAQVDLCLDPFRRGFDRLPVSVGRFGQRILITVERHGQFEPVLGRTRAQ